jgi:hypothetical protein
MFYFSQVAMILIRTDFMRLPRLSGENDALTAKKLGLV